MKLKIKSPKETFESLMPVINANLDEVVLEGKNEPLNPTPLKDGNTTDIFQTKKNKKVKLPKSENTGKQTKKTSEENIIVKGKEEIEELESNTDDLRPTKKREYPHLVKARAKAQANRQAKKLEKDRLKEISDARKLEIKAKKGEERIERNRVANRENYRKKQIEKKEKLKVEEKIEKIQDVEVKEKVEKLVESGMTYKQFSMYMTMYDRDKRLLEATKKENTFVKKQEPPPPPIPSRHPENYWNPNRRNYKRNPADLFNL